MLKKFKIVCKSLFQNIFLDKNETLFIKLFNKNEDSSSKNKAELNVLFQMPEDYFYAVLFSLIAKFLKKKNRINLNWINLNCEYQREGTTSFLKRRSFYERKWTKLYLSNGGKVIHSNLYYEKNDHIEKLASDSFANIKSKEDLIILKHKEIVIGDLVYDTYLRYKPAPTVNIKDPFLEQILKSAFYIFENFEMKIKEVNFHYLFTSYCAYIQHGIPVRIALREKIKVISFGNYDQLARVVDEHYPTHFKDYTNYKELFSKLSNSEKENALNISREHLKSRFDGRVDVSTYYMGKSAFSTKIESKKILKESSNKKIILFLHCFFDSPHIHRWMDYPDFYDWLDRTLEIVSNKNVDFYVKSHPNAIEGNNVIVEEFKNKFKKINFLSAEVNNNQLIAEGFDLAITVYGTLGHEYPYFGIPVLNAGDNPHINYNFCIHPKNRQEYENYLDNLESFKFEKDEFKKEIEEFYYMHNFYHFPGKLNIEENSFINQELRTISSSEKLKDFMKIYVSNLDYQEKVNYLINKSVNEII
jgi:hypothetical protein